MSRLPDIPALLASWRTWPWHLIFVVGLILILPGMLIRPAGAAGLVLSAAAVITMSAAIVAAVARRDSPVLGAPAEPRVLVPDTAVGTASTPASAPLPDTDLASFVYDDIPEGGW